MELMARASKLACLAVAIAAGASSACVVYESSPPPRTPTSARALASNDLGCPFEAVDVVPIGGDEFLAYGCGRRETFACANADEGGEQRCDPLVARDDDASIVPASYVAPPPTCYAACSASSSATCVAQCNGGATPSP